MIGIALAGLGTVGSGVARLLRAKGELIAARAGKKISLVAISGRDKNKKRDESLAGATWVDDPRQLAAMVGVDIVVEVMGGAEGAARDLAEAALKQGKILVTANKALLAKHGAELARLAEAHGGAIFYEAAVAGGIPVVKTLREGLAANRISMVSGILNGTCNYILTRMRDAKLDFAAALAEAQTKGYAEADPAADIDGRDAADKLTLLAALAFGMEPNLAAVQVQGIRAVSPDDIRYADELGCRIKLLAVAQSDGAGVMQVVAPCLVSAKLALGHIDGVTNAVRMVGDFAGPIFMGGAGAGGEATASAVVADIIDAVRGVKIPVFGVPTAQLKAVVAVAAAQKTRYYMRLDVMDKTGAVTDIAAALRDEGISMQDLLQHGAEGAASVPVVITTHAVEAEALQRAVAKLAALPVMASPPCVMRIVE